MTYTAEYQRPYEGGYVNLPSESTPEKAEYINRRDDTLIKIEKYLADLDLSGLGSDYALLSEAGHSLELGIDSNYLMTISLKNKAGSVLSSKQIDFPIESMVVNATYENGKIILTLQNGNTLPIDISDMVRGLVPTTRKIAGIDLVDDITKEELKDALGVGEGGGEIPTKVSQLENDSGYVTQDDIIDADAVAVGEIKPWLYDENEEVIVGVYNGKPLYRKTINYDCTNQSFSDWFNIIDMTDYNTETLVDMSGTYQREYQNTRGKIESRSEYNNDNGVIAKLDNNIIWCFVNGYTDILELLIVLEYTKTTDAEGSGNDLKPYGIYDAKLDEIKAEIDEVKNAITETTETTMPNSHEGRFLFKKIKGVCEQGENPSPTSQQEIKNSVVSEIKTHDDNGNESSVTLSKPIELYGIGDVQDVIEDGKVKRRFAKLRITSALGWSVATTGSLAWAYTAGLTDFKFVKTISSKQFGNAISNISSFTDQFPKNNAFSLWYDNAYNGYRLSFCNNYTADLEAWKQYIDSNEVYVVYEIAEEVTEDLPLADQIALNSLATFDGITYLEFDSEIEPTFEGEYGTSKVGGMTLESLLTARNNDLRLSSLEASVVNNI